MAQLVTVSAEITGAFQPGEPLSISATVTTPLAPTEYRLRVSSPELDLAQASASQKRQVADARAEATGSGSEGGSQTHTLTVEVPEAGAYTFNVVAEAIGDDILQEAARLEAATLAQTAVWADVREGGGEAVSDIHERWIEGAELLTLGQVAEDGRRGIAARDGGVSGKSGFSTVRIVYYDALTDTYPGVPNVKVSTQNNSGGTTSYSDADGYASVVCSPSGSSPLYTLGTARTEGSTDVRVYRDPDWHIPWNESTLASTFGDPPCGATGFVVLNTDMGLMYATFQKAAQEYEAYYGQSRNLVEAFLLPNDDRGYYYNHVSDNIVVQDGSLGSGYGFYVLAHEYGHAFHTKALGDFAHGKCGSDPHYFREAINMACAFAEGFADFKGAFAVEEFFEDLHPGAASQVDFYRRRVARNEGYPGVESITDDNYVDDPTVVTDGSRIEGAVAALFYDFYDPSGVGPSELPGEAAFDFVQYPGTYLGSMLRTCTVNPDDQNGMDQILACIKGGPLPYTNGFFGERPVNKRVISASNSSGRPPSWNLSNFDKLWRKVLFGIDPVPPNNDPLAVSILGPSTVPPGSQGTWTASISNAQGSVTRHWEWKSTAQGSGGGGPVIIGEVDQIPTHGVWTDGGTGTTLTRTMYSSYAYLDIRLTVSDNTTTRVTTRRIYPSGGA